jgi:hypothetical protein
VKDNQQHLPCRSCYRVRREGDLLLMLSYYERGDRWTAAEMGGG